QNPQTSGAVAVGPPGDGRRGAPEGGGDGRPRDPGGQEQEDQRPLPGRVVRGRTDDLPEAGLPAGREGARTHGGLRPAGSSSGNGYRRAKPSPIAPLTFVRPGSYLARHGG